MAVDLRAIFLISQRSTTTFQVLFMKAKRNSRFATVFYRFAIFLSVKSHLPIKMLILLWSRDRNNSHSLQNWVKLHQFLLCWTSMKIYQKFTLSCALRHWKAINCKMYFFLTQHHFSVEFLVHLLWAWTNTQTIEDLKCRSQILMYLQQFVSQNVTVC